MSDVAPPFSETVLREDVVLERPVTDEASVQPGAQVLHPSALRTPLTTSGGPGEVYDKKWIEAPGTIKADNGPAPAHVNEFANVLCLHNDRLSDIKQLKVDFNAKMKTDQVFRDAVARLYNDSRSMKTPKPALVSGDDLAKRLGVISGGTPFARRNGHRKAYDPWDGWWTGIFTSVRTNYLNYHVWDPTVAVRADPSQCTVPEAETRPRGDVQYIQMVTQIAATSAAAPTRKTDPSFWFAGANFMRNGLHPLNKTDFAINVWSEKDGLTGYVLKRQTGEEHLPLFAYLLDDETLLWVTFVEGGTNRLTARSGNKATFVVYAERADRKGTSREYFIRGAIAPIEWVQVGAAPGSYKIGALNQISQHRGDYKIAKKARHPNAPATSPKKP